MKILFGTKYVSEIYHRAGSRERGQKEVDEKVEKRKSYHGEVRCVERTNEEKHTIIYMSKVNCGSVSEYTYNK